MTDWRSQGDLVNFRLTAKRAEQVIREIASDSTTLSWDIMPRKGSTNAIFSTRMYFAF